MKFKFRISANEVNNIARSGINKSVVVLANKKARHVGADSSPNCL